jgi:hypothetical protein
MIGSRALAARSSRQKREAAVDVGAQPDVDDRELGQHEPRAPSMPPPGFPESRLPHTRAR